MSVFKWQRRATTYFGDVWVPFAHVDLGDAHGRFRSFALQVDSGAVVSLLRRSAGELLGLHVESGRRVQLGSVGGGIAGAYVHVLPTRFDENLVLPVEFAIADSETVPNLLGRRNVFDDLQVDFDATLQRTALVPKWLDDGDKQLWETICGASETVAQRWRDNPLPEPGDEAGGQILRRGEQLFATAAGMMKLFRTWDAPLIVRAMFEVSLQFEYLMQSPAERGRSYLDFSKVTRYRHMKRIVGSAKGTIGRGIADSPMRDQGEIRNQEEFDAVARQFRRGGGSFWDSWYCKSLAQLSEELGARGEYDIWYKFAAGWAHGDPFSTQRIAPCPGDGTETLFQACLHFFGRMLYHAAERKRIVLSADQVELVRKCLQRLD